MVAVTGRRSIYPSSTNGRTVISDVANPSFVGVIEEEKVISSPLIGVIVAEILTVAPERATVKSTVAPSKAFTIAASVAGYPEVLTDSATLRVPQLFPLLPETTISDLVKDTDYIVSYSNNIDTGYGICTCEGINNYCGISNTMFTIAPKSLEEYEINLSKRSYEFTNTPIIPDYSINGLKPGIDYTIRCENNIMPGEATIYATGRGNNTDTISTNYIVYMDSEMSTKTLILTPEKMTYSGNPCCPDVDIIGLIKDTDYTVSYRNNIESGTGIVIATGRGNYTGYKEQEFTIEKCHISLKNSYLDTNDYIYDGTPKTPTAHVEGLT